MPTMDNSSRGMLIVIEGLDRAGKSTQVDRLVQNLAKSGRKVEKIRFPDRTTPIGASINTYLQGQTNTNDHAIHLLFSANRWEAAESISAKLMSGTTLVVDRYSYSGAVYSAAKHNPALDLDWAWSMEVGLPSPDVVIYLTLSLEVQRQRGGFGEERYENEGMQGRVRVCFERLWKRWRGPLVTIDADGTIEALEGRILDAVNEARFQPVGTALASLAKLG